MSIHYCKRCHRTQVSRPDRYCEPCKQFCIRCGIKNRVPGQNYCYECAAARREAYVAVNGRAHSLKRNAVRRNNPELWRLHLIRNRPHGYYRERPEEKPTRCEFCGGSERVMGVNIGAVHDRPFWILWLCYDHRIKLNRLTDHGRPDLQKKQAAKGEPGGKGAEDTEIQAKPSRRQAARAERQGRTP